MEKVCSVKDHVERMKREAAEWENIMKVTYLIKYFYAVQGAIYAPELPRIRLWVLSPHSCLASVSDLELSPYFIPCLLIGFS